VSHFNKIPAELVVSVHPSVLGFDQQRATELFPTGWTTGMHKLWEP